MDDIGKVLFGALIGFLAALVGEYWKRVHASRVAAMMVLRELEFHQQRLSWAITLDQVEHAQYELKFPSPVWSAHAEALLAGAPTQKAEAVLNWYATMVILGYSLGRQIGPEGPQLIGPDRARLSAALADAHSAAVELASRWRIRKNNRTSLPLFDEVAHEIGSH